MAATGDANDPVLKCEPIVRAFLAAHLLTGNMRRAEEITLEALGAWDPLEQSEEALFERITSLAARAQEHEGPSDLTSPLCLPKKLKAVLKLEPRLRLCFVPRILVGLGAQTCARALGLQLDQINEYTGAAMQLLPLAARQTDSERS